MSSASLPSARVVKPTRSAKSTETRRRSAIGAAAARDGAWGDAAAADVATVAGTAVNGVAHSPQNFVVGGFVDPQLGQTEASFDPHSPQNLRPASFSAPQLGQVTRTPSSSQTAIRTGENRPAVRQRARPQMAAGVRRGP